MKRFERELKEYVNSHPERSQPVGLSRQITNDELKQMVSKEIGVNPAYISILNGGEGYTDAFLGFNARANKSLYYCKWHYGSNVFCTK